MAVDTGDGLSGSKGKASNEKVWSKKWTLFIDSSIDWIQPQKGADELKDDSHDAFPPECKRMQLHMIKTDHLL